MLVDKILGALKSREFISVATCNLDNRPNAAPKFFLKVEAGFIYLVDYTIGRTWENLKVNPRASLSFVDVDTLMCYQINGTVEIIDKGPIYDKVLSEVREKLISLSTVRIIEGVSTGKPHKGFELSIGENFVILKVKIEEAAEIGQNGEVARDKI